MKKYLWKSSAAVVTGTLKVNFRGDLVNLALYSTTPLNKL